MITDYFIKHRRDIPPAERRELEHSKKLDKLVDNYLESEKAPEKLSKVMEFINAQPEEDRDKLNKRAILLSKFYGKPDRDFFLKLRYVPPKVRAAAFLSKFDNANKTRQEELRKQLEELPGINTDKFRQEIKKLRSEVAP
jgi:hypothetical protein